MKTFTYIVTFFLMVMSKDLLNNPLHVFLYYTIGIEHFDFINGV